MLPFINRNKPELLWFLYIAVLLLIHNGSISLWDQDEAAYAGYANNMVNSGNWLVPDFMWSDVHRKPPLHFWGIAAMYQLFGTSEFATRLVASLSVFTVLLVVFWQVKRVFDKKTALLASVVLGTSFLVPALGKIAVTDGLLLFFTSICGFSVIQLMQTKKWIWTVCFWAAFALALLTKGPPIIIFSIGFIGLLAVFHPNRKALIRLHPWFFLPLAFFPLLYWGYLTVQAGGKEFIDWMIDWYILKRVAGSVFGQTAPPGFHLLAMAVFFLPYFLFFPFAIKMGIKGLLKKKEKIIFLGAWFVAGWLIYEFSPSKLPAYVIAAHVPLAVLIALQMQKQVQPTIANKAVTALHFFLTSVLFGGLVIAPFLLELPAMLKWTAVTIGASLLLVNGFAYLRLVKQKSISIVIAVALLFQFSAWGILMPQVDELKNATKRTAQFVADVAPENTQVVIANKFGRPPSLPFYLMQNFQNVSEEYDIEKLKTFYSSQQPVAIILSKELSSQFKAWNPEIEITEISSLATDRKQRMNYYVVLNQ